jgi:putative transposase
LPRAHRYFLPDTVWHITHRCHNREFLLRFEKDRRRWKFWLFQARKRYGLSVLNYIATSNHIHLLVHSSQDSEVSRGLQLLAGRTAQEYNRRKQRKGAFWEDRFFATAIGTDEHLTRCLVYIDLNMVRACVVSHPSEWTVSGYNEIHSPPQRYRIIDQAAMCRLFDCASWAEFQDSHRQWVQHSLDRGPVQRDPIWTESVAVGHQGFVADIKSKLGRRAYHRTDEKIFRDTHVLQDSIS